MSEILRKLFQPGRRVSVHELYKPSAMEDKRYAQWVDNRRYDVLNDRIRQECRKTVLSKDYSGFVRFYRHQSSNCVSIHAGSSVAREDLMPLTRWYADKIRTFGYRLVNQDRLIRELSGYVQKKTRFYLKPPVGYTPPIEQMYGNIILELITEDDRDMYIKCNVTSYNDRNYQAASDFEEFLFRLLD